jgi:carbon-monoxide dehydrogenase small subunit
MNKITFTLNHKETTVETTPSRRLLDVLRDDLRLTGPKEGCGEGECGACSVLLNNRLVNSCLVPLGSVHHQEVLTIEGLATTKQGQLLQQCFEAAGAVQCGICTPGMLMASHALLSMHPHPTREQIQIGLSGNLCRCTGYNMIIKAVQEASKKGEGLW